MNNNNFSADIPKPYSLIAPLPGTRFELYGQNFEINFCSHGTIRYAAIAGGKSYKITVENFNKLQCEKIITINFDSDVRHLNQGVLTETIRRTRYAQCAIAALQFPQSEKNLKLLIPKVAEELNDPNPPSPRSVARFVKKHLETQLPVESQRNRRSGNFSLRFSPVIELLYSEAVTEIHLQPTKNTADDVLDYIIGKLAERYADILVDTPPTLPSERTIQRRLKELDPYVVIYAQRGPQAAKRMAQAAGRTLKSLCPLFMVQIDSHLMDVILVAPNTRQILGRPWITAIIDVYTRMIVGFYITFHSPSAISSLAAMKEMLEHFGIPTKIIPDNGCEYKNSSFQKLCESLNIILAPAEYRNGNDKPHIERFFRTLTEGVSKKIPGTTFSNPKERGDYDSAKHACATLDQLTEATSFWIKEIYHQSRHTGTGRVPVLFWEDEIKNIVPMRLTASDISALARKPYFRTVRNGQVEVDYLFYYSHALSLFNGQLVTVLIDELNLHSVNIQHPNDKDILIQADSVDPDYTEGLTVHAHQQCKAIKKAVAESDASRSAKLSLLGARYILIEMIASWTKISTKEQKKIGRSNNIVIEALKTFPQKVTAKIKQKYICLTTKSTKSAMDASAPISDDPYETTEL